MLGERAGEERLLWQEEVYQHRVDGRQHDQDDPELIPDNLESCRRSL